MNESEFIDGLRAIATHPAARGLVDDAAVLDVGAGQIVLTHDMLVESVHYLANDPAESVAWKLVAVNMSDLAAKGARPLGVILGFALTQDSDWERTFTTGLQKALAHFGVPLLGGDTVSMPQGAPRTLGLTAFGQAPSTGAPSRTGARPDDMLFVSGPVGDAGAGLALLQGRLDALDKDTHSALIAAYQKPQPDLALGQAIAPYAHAMSDISDGLLIDAQRMAHASGCALHIDMEHIPLSPAYLALRGDNDASRLAAATSGDDYCLLIAAPADQAEALTAHALEAGGRLVKIGQCIAGQGLSLAQNGYEFPLPDRLGYQHGTLISD